MAVFISIYLFCLSLSNMNQKEWWKSQKIPLPKLFILLLQPIPLPFSWPTTGFLSISLSTFLILIYSTTVILQIFMCFYYKQNSWQHIW